jgi:UDP-arabinose 4-epimerase
MVRHRPSAVIHFAASAYVGESVRDPAKYYRNNVVGTLSLLDVMRASDLKRIVFSSSCATYGAPERTPIGEDAPQRPINPYGMTKLTVERVLADYAVGYEFRSVALRYFNAAGADPEGEIGEEHDPETHLIPLVLEAASGGREAVTIFGNDYDTPDGTCIRDYVHVSDIADAHVRALPALDFGDPAKAFNLGTGAGVSVAEVVARARMITGRDIPVIVGPRRAGDPPSLVAAPGRAREMLGWTPRYAGLDGMIKTAWDWRRSPRHQGTSLRLRRGSTLTTFHRRGDASVGS